MEFKTNIEAKVSGQTRFVIKGKNGEIKADTGYNPNLLLDKFFTASTFGGSVYAAVGVGTTPPNNTDTGCTNQLGVRSAPYFNDGTNITSGDETIGWTWTSSNKVFRWGLGEIVGNISEYALHTSTSGANAIVKNLIKDGQGNPTTISVTADDQLEIWWKLSKHIPNKAAFIAAETTTNVVLNGVATDVRFTMVNPTHYINNVDISIGPSTYTAVYYAKASVISDSGPHQEIYLANAGDTLVLGTGEIDNNTNWTPGYPVYDYSIPGVHKKTITYTLPLQTNAALTPTKFIAMDYYGAPYIHAAGTGAIIRFNPEFVRGPDKIMTFSVSQVSTRA